MIELENYKSNIEIAEKAGISDVIINKGVVFRGSIHDLNKNISINKEGYSVPPLGAAIVGLNNTAAPLPKNEEFYNAWSDIDAQELYVNKKPTCYLILCKPGAGAYTLGEAISKKLNCIHLCPRNILLDEIEQKSPTGICLQYNMHLNKVCAFDNILKMLKVKLESAAVKHRGYIISGFPLVTCSRDPKYLIKTLTGEEAITVVDDFLFDIISNLKKKKPKKPKEPEGSRNTSVTSEEEPPNEEDEVEELEPEELAEEEEELKVDLPKFVLDACSDIINPVKPYYIAKKAMLLQQLKDLFSLNMKPDIVIYLSCPDKDLVTKRSHKYMNYKTTTNSAEPFHPKVSLEVRWPLKYDSYDHTNPFDIHVFNPKYSCRQPINFEDRSIEQICNYRHDLLPNIKNIFKDFKPKYIIKLDARLTLHELMHNVSKRLLMLPIMPVIIPEPLYMEQPPDDIEEFWKVVEESNVIHNDVVTFKRIPSAWYNRCPVELKKRQSVNGNPKLAVIFGKYVYLHATLVNLVSFWKNPRPYLQLKYLEPTCRIAVIGTKLSGKTMISECLSWLFDTPVIYYNSIVESERQKKYDTYAKTILSEIIATIEDARYAEWQTLEMERFAKLEAWCKTKIKLLSKYIPLLLVFTSYDKLIPSDDDEVPSEKFLEAYHTLRRDLDFLPILDDINKCKETLEHSVMAKYAPQDYMTPTIKPSIPVLGDPDVTDGIAAYIVANELQKEIEPTVEELMSVLVRTITLIDQKCHNDTNFDSMFGKYIIDGLPSDPECWGILSETKCLPDYTIALIENREVEPELLEYYKNLDNVMKNHHERYSSANDPLLEIKLRTKSIPDTKELDMKMIVYDVIKDTIDTYFTVDEKDKPESSTESGSWATFTEDIEKFKEEWEGIKGKIGEYDKCYIDVELEFKTDIQVIEDVLLKLRKCYFLPCEVNEGEEADDQDEENEPVKDMMTYNNSQHLGETSKYCPIAFFDHGVLWEGKPELSVIFNSKLHYFSNEECLELFQKDVTKYQNFNIPCKKIPSIRICVIGCIGSGKTTISKMLAKELGLIHVDFVEAINDFLLPKHYKKVGRQYENPFTDPLEEEAAVEFQMDEDNENLIADILSNETELRRIINNYFENGAPLLPLLMQKVIHRLWYQKPFLTTGFVLDGYPKLSADVEDMAQNYCIPDLVLEIEGSSENSAKRLSSLMVRKWKIQLGEAKEKARKKLANEKKEWMNFLSKNIVPKLILDEIIESMVITAAEPVKELSNESVMMDADPSGSVVDTKLLKMYNDMIEEYPEPVDVTEWEKPDEVRERMNERVESLYETDDENIQELKEALSEQKIKVVAVDGNKPLIKVARLALFKVAYLRNRNESLFEQTFVINPDIAELLIGEGFWFLSKFNRTCPVYLYENPHAIQNIYSIRYSQDQVYPIVHRSYIYFISGSESVKKFRTNPLKYVTCDNIRQFVEYPLRIGVIGAPKSGKSLLSAKLAKRYGLICLSKGIAIRDVLNNKYWTALGTKMMEAICSGDCISTDLIMESIQNMTMDHRALTNGFVLDGCPQTASEAMELVRMGLYPNIVFDISNQIETSIRSSQKEIYYDIIKGNPPYSSSFIDNRYHMWQNKCYNVREWINEDYQNTYILDGNKSRWQCWQDAVNVINDFIPKVHHYLTNVHTDAVSAHVMCISNEIFQNRMSNLKNMCPLCLRKNVLKHNAYPVDKKGVIQFRNQFYWVCSEHMETVLQTPHFYLTMQKIDLPEIPAVVKTVDMSLVHANGICIVTYAEHLPAQKLSRGTNKFAANYRGKTYMFCSKACLEKFLAKPHMYFDITLFKETIFSPFNLKSLPNLGYLEQTLGTILTEACCSVNVHRPKYPGLSFQVSGLLHIGLYLKTHNPLTEKSVTALYDKASKVYDARCRLLMHVALFLRSMDNPFASYPKCCGDTSLVCDSGTTKKHTSSESSSRDSLTTEPHVEM